MIIGRKKEQKLLEKAYRSKEAEFITIYGRRRVGKTFLIRSFFAEKNCTFFHTTGLQKGSTATQLQKFADALSQTFFYNVPVEKPKNWSEAFNRLNQIIAPIEGKVVIFLDELPWLATKKSGLLTELDYQWNKNWSAMSKVILVVCGSSASWLIQKIIYNKGGLHNRTTIEIELLPFSLSEADEFLKSRAINLNQKHVLNLYMALGGIPFYLKYVEPALTAEQNIQDIFFTKKAPLQDEFTKLFDSLFDGADAYKELIRLISKKKNGVARSELAAETELSHGGGGRLSQRLKNLCATGFIEEFTPWGKTKGEYYKLIDEFSLFYLHWIENHEGQFPKDYWLDQSQKPAYHAWAGYAFEAVCMKHIDAIVQALGIRSAKAISTWRYVPKKKSPEKGAQIDLVIDRSDHAMNLCEIKYTEQPFALDKQSAEKLQHAVKLFKQRTKTDKQLFLSLVSANGIKDTMYSEELISSTATLQDLFKA